MQFVYLRHFPNKFAKRCEVCGVKVEERAGYTALRRVVVSGSEQWVTYCKSTACLPQEIVSALNARKLTADGRVIGYEGEEWVKWVKRMPGARFVSAANGGPFWRVSLHPSDRAQVLEIARKLKLDIAPELLTVEPTAGMSEDEKELAELINTRLAYAKERGAYPYQLVGIKFLLENKRCLLGDEPGLGKTLESLSSIPSDMGALVIVPASVKYNWAKEVKMWRPDLSVRVVSGRCDSLDVWPTIGEVVIINYDILPDTPPPEDVGLSGLMIIADEAHAFKNTRTKRHKVMKSWGKAAERFVIMTGTPMTNRPPDLWGTLEVAGLAKKVFGSQSNFRKLFGVVGRGGAGTEWGMPDPSVPVLLRRVMLRRTQEEVLPDLPPYTRRTHIVSKQLDPGFLEELDEIYDNVKAELDAKQLPDFTRMAKVRSMLATVKIDDMLSVIKDYEENDTPLVVFSAHKAPVKAAASRPGWEMITGETSQLERQAIVERFQRGELCGLALTIAAGSVGITLTRASHMLFVDLDWTPSLNHQAECRIRRVGQKANHLTYTRMAFEHPLDMRVEELLQWKTELHVASIDAVTDEGIVQVKRQETAPSLWAGETYEPSIVKVVQETVEERQRRAAQSAADMAREAARKLVAHRMEAQERARAMALEDKRKRQAEASVHDWLHGLRAQVPAFVRNCIEDRHGLRDALVHLLGNCDGAQQHDGVGFNKLDAMTARRMTYLDIERDRNAAEAVALLLYKYRGQLTRAGFGHLFQESQHA